MITTLLFLLAALLIALAGLMSAVDAALLVSSRSDLLDHATKGRNTRSLARISDAPDDYATMATFMRVALELAGAVVATIAFLRVIPAVGWAGVVAILVLTGVVFVAVASSPRSVGRRHAAALLTWTAPLLRATGIVAGPFSRGLVSLGNRVTPGAGRRSFESEEQLLSMVDEAVSHDLLEEDDRALIHSVFEFTDQIVRVVMVPRTEMVTVDASASPRDAVRVFLERGISRMPVIDGEVDEVIGVLYLKDLVQHAFRDGGGWQDGAGLRALTRPAVFVPEQMRAETLLQQMKRDAVHVCIVVDEYGGVAGLVTLEDLIEELVGDISDEYDAPSTEIVELTPGSYRVSASLGLDEVGDLFDLELDDEDVDSIGGLLGKHLGRVPQPGDATTASGLLLTGGTSRGRGRGIATVLVERGEALQAVEDARARGPRTGEVRLPAVSAAADADRRAGDTPPGGRTKAASGTGSAGKGKGAKARGSKQKAARDDR